MDGNVLGGMLLRSSKDDLEETDLSDAIELPGAIMLSEVVVEILPRASDEFVCDECFTVRHRSHAARTQGDFPICPDCVDI